MREATIENTYRLITALGLKQLDKHNRPIGILNKNGAFDGLAQWFDRAEKETFITPKCRFLMSVAKDEAALQDKLQNQEYIHIDLHKEKWGPGETPKHLEIHETE